MISKMYKLDFKKYWFLFFNVKSFYLIFISFCEYIYQLNFNIRNKSLEAIPNKNTIVCLNKVPFKHAYYVSGGQS